jgi:hypothetical protein
MSPLAAVQRLYTRYRAIADDTLYLGDGRPRAIFELHPPNLSLADDDTLEVVAQQLAGVFNSLRFATQLLFRLVAVDLDGHAADAEQAAAHRGPELAAAGREYAALLRHLGRTLVLLEPHIYLVVGLEGAQGSLLRPIAGWFMRRTRRGSRLSVAGQADTDLLDQRGEQVALAFDAIGARPRRLANVEIAELLYACWCPERARRQPLRIERRAS